MIEFWEQFECCLREIDRSAVAAIAADDDAAKDDDDLLSTLDPYHTL